MPSIIKRALQNWRNRNRRKTLLSEMRGLLVMQGGNKLAHDVAEQVFDVLLSRDYSEGYVITSAIDCGLEVQRKVSNGRAAKPMGWNHARTG